MAAVRLAWWNDNESSLTFSKSNDERRGILSALHQSRATQLLIWGAQESKSDKARKVVWGEGILKK